MQDINEKDLEDITKDLMIVSGYRFSVRDIIQGSNLDENGIRYSEIPEMCGMLENVDEVQKINEYTFFSVPKPFRNTWNH